MIAAYVTIHLCFYLSPIILPSAHLFTCPCSPDATPHVAGAPGAPLSVKVYDVNSDYVLVAWKPPNIVNESAVTGYFVDRSVPNLKPLQAPFL